MSILISGMEMPTSRFACPFRRKVDPDNIMCIVTREVFEETFDGTIQTRNRGDCPLVPVPQHGRLIDADVLKRNIAANLPAAFQDFTTGLCFIVDMQKTVIGSELEG